MRINQGYTDEYSSIDEKSNIDATRFIKLLKDSSESLWDGCTNHSKLSGFAQVFII